MADEIYMEVLFGQRYSISNNPAISAESKRLYDLLEKMSTYTMELYIWSAHFNKLATIWSDSVDNLPPAIKETLDRCVVLFLNRAPVNKMVSEQLLKQSNRNYLLSDVIERLYKGLARTVLYDDLYYVKWCCIMLVITAKLYHHGGFRTAPFIVSMALYNISKSRNKFNAFRAYGCDV